MRSCDCFVLSWIETLVVTKRSVTKWWYFCNIIVNWILIDCSTLYTDTSQICMHNRRDGGLRYKIIVLGPTQLFYPLEISFDLDSCYRSLRIVNFTSSPFFWAATTFLFVVSAIVFRSIPIVVRSEVENGPLFWNVLTNALTCFWNAVWNDLVSSWCFKSSPDVSKSLYSIINLVKSGPLTIHFVSEVSSFNEPVQIRIVQIKVKNLWGNGGNTKLTEQWSAFLHNLIVLFVQLIIRNAWKRSVRFTAREMSSLELMVYFRVFFVKTLHIRDENR